MAGHSKWKNIQHRKGAQDAKRGKVFTKIIKEIVVAVKTGGGDDPESNPRLRAAITSAKSVNMPRDNIERAIKKAAGGDSANLLELTYEAYGPDGCAIFIECATDNRVRTVSNIRAILARKGGTLGKDGCLQFIFDRSGVFSIEQKDLDEEAFTMEMIDAGAEDVELEDNYFSVVCAMEEFGNIQKKLNTLKVEASEAGLQRVPNSTKSLEKESFEKFIKLVDALEDDDDVQKVYHNVEYDEELIQSLM